MTKRVLIFSLAYYPSFVSGAEAAIKEITDRISEDAIDFHLITLLFDTRALRKEKIGSVTVHRVGFGGAYLSKIFFIPLAALKARELNRERPFNAVWSMMTYMLFPAVLARVLGVSAPRVLTLQDGDPYEKVFERPFIKPIAGILDYGFRTTAIIQVISNYLATWPARRGYAGRIELIRNGANPRDLKNSVPEAEVEVVKQQLHKKPGEVFLINTSRLVHQKANDDTIRALTMLPDTIRLILVGDGPDRPMLEALANELGVTDRVTFVGAVDRTSVSAYRKAADIFVAPSRSEGLGNAFLSAMASRVPVVLTQEGGIADYLFDEKRNPDHQSTGWAVDKDAPEQIVQAVRDILENPEKVQRITANARRIVEEEYDWDRIAQQMEQRVFNSVFSL